MENSWGKLVRRVLFSATFCIGFDWIIRSFASTEYVPLWFRNPPKTENQHIASGFLYVVVPFVCLTNPVIQRLNSNAAELRGLVQRRLWSFLVCFECFLLMAHLIIAKGSEYGIMAISGASTMAISGVQLVAAPQDSFAVSLFFLVNSAVASSVLTLSNNGSLSPAAVWALTPAVTAIPAMVRISYYSVFLAPQQPYFLTFPYLRIMCFQCMDILVYMAMSTRHAKEE